MEIILLFLAGFFLATYILGRVFEKFRIPWIFSSLFIGFIISVKGNPFVTITSSATFDFLAQLGMFFLLFIIGFELDLIKTIRKDPFIIKGAFVIILSETIVGTFLMHYVFGLDWVISMIVASSFATVGETVLLPILDEFKLTNTRLGKNILGVGVIDDFFEIFIIVIAVGLVSQLAGHSHNSIGLTVFLLVILISLVYITTLFQKVHARFVFKDIPSFFVLVLFFLFLFVGIGGFVEAGSLGAILAGVALRNLIDSKHLKLIDSEVKTISYGFLAPIFFLWVGINTEFTYLSQSIWLVLAVVFTTAFAKITSTYFIGRKILGKKESIIAGIGLTVKLSTSIVIIKLFFDQGLIGNQVYSVLVLASIIFSIVVPILLPILIKKWDIRP